MALAGSRLALLGAFALAGIGVLAGCQLAASSAESARTEDGGRKSSTRRDGQALGQDRQDPPDYDEDEDLLDAGVTYADANTSPPADAAPITPIPPVPSSGRDPAIEQAVANVSSSRIMSIINTLVAFETRNSCSTDKSATVGIGAAREWLRGQYENRLGAGRVLFDPYTQTGCSGSSRTGQNVVGWIPGRSPDRIIVVGGHYDSRGGDNAYNGEEDAPGANDSGSQTALVLEAAQVLAGKSFEATLVFVSFAGEEGAILGSKGFVRSYAKYFPGKIEAMINLDLIGGDVETNTGDLINQFRLFSPGTPREVGNNSPDREGSTDDTSPARGIMRYIGTAGMAYVPGFTMQPKLRQYAASRPSDHNSFLDQGIPAVRFMETRDNTAHRHSQQDLARFVSPEYVRRITQTVVATAASMAAAPAAPSAIMVTGNAGGAMRVTWSAPSSPVHHYVVAARPVTENFYRKRFVVAGASTSATVTAADLGLSVGTALFLSVAAVDAQGHESIFAYPEYRCDSSECTVQAGSLDVTATRTF